MEKCSGAHRAFCVKSFYTNGDPATTAKRLFRNQFNIPRQGQISTIHVFTQSIAGYSFFKLLYPTN